jgi:hypothetical protein
MGTTLATADCFLHGRGQDDGSTRLRIDKVGLEEASLFTPANPFESYCRAARRMKPASVKNLDGLETIWSREVERFKLCLLDVSSIDGSLN